MPRYGGWTSDLGKSADIFARYYPRWGALMSRAAVIGREPTADRAVLADLVHGLGPWLAAEYTRVHGVKAARPY
ncbi:hypothetical protein AB0M28_00155 [Streptomyces sp. NPDC051940]|uniref:hypothetical protein n=1 Tax=Streptomyces sp. NPDC051940 TaxID=3155675 RepID=UPI0034471C5D